MDESSKNHIPQETQTIFYSHWTPLDTSQELHTNQNINNARLVQCTGCEKRIKGSINFPTTASCIIKCQAKFLGRIDHVKLSKSAQLSDKTPHDIAIFPVHIQYFYNLPQTLRSSPQTPIPSANSKTPIGHEIILTNYFESSLILRTSANTVIQNKLTDTFLHFLSIDIDTIEFYTDSSLAKNKSLETMEMSSGWISLNGRREFCCKTFSWPSFTRAEFLAIYTALLSVPCN